MVPTQTVSELKEIMKNGLLYSRLGDSSRHEMAGLDLADEDRSVELFVAGSDVVLQPDTSFADLAKGHGYPLPLELRETISPSEAVVRSEQDESEVLFAVVEGKGVCCMQYRPGWC